MWTIPGGRQKPGETLIETAHREIDEETGVQISIPKLIDVVDLIRHDDNGTLLRHYALIDYAARYISGDPRPGGDAAAGKDAKYLGSGLRTNPWVPGSS